ncbi:MATE family efflux transporter [Hominifimenecus sp. rT4P-3]|uniref:MATE family efflux transporter n=1 Tax=Hominifimenecus sp. rT4P-3 TaxID=3242979 RepID=UPI003DA5FBE9
MRTSSLIGNKNFYRMVLAVAVPIMIQNGITNFVSLLDNIMVGQVGTEQMSGVAIVNQLIFVYNLCIFGGLSGAGIFTAQFYGQGNDEGIRHTFRFKIWIGFLVTLVALLIFGFGMEPLIRLYLHESGEAGNIENALFFAKQYLRMMLVGLIPFCLVQIYASTLRETGETVLPMKAGILAVFVNMCLNYILIFGKLGFPALGVTGAAIATVTSRFVECGIVLIWTHCHKSLHPYIEGIYRTLKLPRRLTGQIICKGMPLLVNEGLWSAGMAVLMQCYSIRGLDVVAGMNISSTLVNLFNVVFLALGTSISILVGQQLGAGKMEETKDMDKKMIFFSVICSTCLALVLAVVAPLFPKIYNTTDEIRRLACDFLWIAALFMPQHAFMNAAYFTLRSGGKTLITFAFDSLCTWVLNIPLAFVLSRYTGLSIFWVYFLCQAIDLFKSGLGFYLVKKGVWIHRIVE